MELVRLGSTVSQAKTEKTKPGLARWRRGRLVTVMLRMASPFDEGFRALVFYLPVCAKGGLFSATTCGGADAFGRAARMGCPAFVVWAGKTWKGYSPVPGAKIRTLRQAQGGSGAPRFSCGDMGHPPAKFSTSMRLPHRAGSVHGKAIWQQLAAHAQPNFRIADQPGVDRLFNAYRTMSSMVWPETLSGH